MTTKITREYLANSALTALPIVAPAAANAISTFSTPPEQGSLYFGGDSNTLTFSNFTGLGSGDFTVECWANTESVSSSRGLWDTRANNTSVTGLMLREDGAANLIVVNGSTTILTGANVRVANTWQHIAVVRESDTLTLYVDGVSANSTTLATALTDTNFRLSGLVDSQNSTYAYKGRLSALHVVDTATYTGNFTVPKNLIDINGSSNTLVSLAVPDDSPSFKSDASNSDIFSITVNGTLPTAFSPYNTSWSGYFDGSDTLSIAQTTALDLGSGDFTIEAWIWPVSRTGNQRIIAKQVAASPSWIFRLNGTTGYPFLEIDGSGIVTATSAPDLNAWSHIAVVRSSNTVTIYINGVSAGSASYTGTPSAGSVATYIGSNSNINEFFTGYISNLRFVKGTAVYTSNFTPPTSLLTAVAGTSLLTCQSNRFIDNSVYNHQIIVNADAAIYPGPFADTDTVSGSGYFDGSNDWLRIPNNNSEFTFGTGDFCVEGWFYTLTNSVRKSFYSGVSNNSFDIQINVPDASGSIGVGLANNRYDFYATTGILKNRQWYHLAVSRESGTMRVFLNGSLVNSGSETDSYGALGGAATIGVANSTEHFFHGYLSDMRVTKGAAVRTSNFSLPTEPVDPVEGTVLLTLQKRTSDVGTFVDISQNKNIITRAGSVYLSSRSPYHTPGTEYSPATHGTSMYFDGSGDYLSTPSSAGLTFGTGDFTIEGWFYAVSSTNNKGLFMLSSTAGGLQSNSSNNLAVALDGGSSRYVVYAANQGVTRSPPGPQLNTWTHFALVRTSGVTKLYINGTQAGADITDTVNYSASYLAIGGYYSTSYLLNGYISNFRVVKGTALYTANNFTPPNTPLTAVSGTSLLVGGQLPYYDRSGTTTITPSNISTSVSDPLEAEQSRYITFNGKNFIAGTRVSLNNRYFANSVRIVDSTQLVAEIPADVPNGTYDVYLIRPNGRFSIFPDGLTLV